MRYLVAVCLLAGCYSPSTESCYYRCATQGTPCPSGLECVAGMCAARGETCAPIGEDAPGDGGPDIDGPPPACGDGTATRGEICYAPPITFMASANPFDGQLADVDGDGDVDLIYATSNGAVFHENKAGVLATSSSPGPTTSGTMLRTVNLGPASSSIELVIASSSAIQTWENTGNGSFTNLGTFPLPNVLALETGNVTASPAADLIVLAGSALRAYRYGIDFQLTLVGTTPAQVGATASIATGRMNGDVTTDVAVGGSIGIVVMLGDAAAGFAPMTSTPVTTPVDDLDVGDVNGDGKNDIVFVRAPPPGAPGVAGVMLGNGDGTFAPQLVSNISDMGNVVAVRDLDGDNRADVASVRTSPPRMLVIARGATAGMFDPPVMLPLPGAQTSSISMRGDVNGDSVADLVVTDPFARALYVYLSNP